MIFKMPVLLKLSLLLIMVPIISTKVKRVKEGPRGMPINKTTSCEEFGKNARFNPHSIVNDIWFVFYHWGLKLSGMTTYKFRIPSKRDVKFMHYLLDRHVRKDFNWSATMVLMVEQRQNYTVLLVEREKPGRFWLYIMKLGLSTGELAQRYSIQFRQTSDNRYVGYMECKDRVAYVMSRITDIPPKVRIQEEAGKLGYRGRKGKSYLYQGHEWMPIPEADEEDYWNIQTGGIGRKAFYSTED